MNKKEILFACLIICFIFSLQAVVAADADSNTTDDSILTAEALDAVSVSNDLSSYSLPEEDSIVKAENDGSNSFSKLQELIDNDTSGVISLDKNYTFNSSSDTDLAQGIVISKDITIEGNGFTIDALSLARIFNIGSGSTVTLKGINFVNGGNASVSNGGSIYSSAQGLTIDSCTFTNSYAAKDGGALFISGEDCKLYNSNFTNNTAGDDGGAINWEGDNGVISNIACENNKGISAGTSNSKGGSICLTGENATISDSSFVDSFATYNGGALFVTGNDVNITGCEFENCKSNVSAESTDKDFPFGGAIYIIGNDTLVDDCTFDECSAVNGGAIYVEGSDALISNSDFTNNNASKDGGVLNVVGDDCELANSTFKDNVAGDDGGVANWEGDRGIIYNITCVNNKGISAGNSSSKGGTICLTGENATISDSSFVDSFATYNGGALFVTGNDVNITGCEFENCKADISAESTDKDFPFGGAIYIIGNDTLVDDCTFEKCSAVNGGAIYVEGSDALISNSDFTNNNASKDGGVLNVVGDDCELANSTFKDNVAGDDGGVANWEGDRGIIYNITCVNNKGISAGTSNSKGGTICLTGENATISDSSFVDSFATYNGGALFVTGNNVNITGCEFENCKADVSAQPTSKDAPDGGAIYIIGNDTFVDDCTFDDCNARYGGSVYVQGSNAVINGSEFTDSSSTNNGGAIFVDGKNTHINESAFSNCGADGHLGGAIYINNQGTNVSNSNFTSNHAAYGGSIFINGIDTNIEYCNFDKNTATSDAGAIQVNGTNAKISYINCTDNKAKGNGGALSIEGQNASVYYSSFDNNDAKVNGGAINWIGGHGDDSIIGCNFTKNNCHGGSNGGGAIFWTAGKTISSGGLIKDCIFADNIASGRHGGAVDWYRTLDSVIDNCTFVNNTSNSDGGALYTGDQNGGSRNLTVSNSRFYNNTAKKHGGAIANQMGNSLLYNNTFDGNKATSSGGTILMKEGAADNSVIDSCYIYNSFVNKPANLAYGEGGGAIRIGKDDTNITIKNTLIVNSTTNSTMGGAISVLAAKCKVDNVTIINATSNDDQGGAIYWTGKDGSLNNVEIVNSSTHTSGNKNRDISGGAIYWTGDNAKFNNVSITNAYTNSTNSRDAHGGAIYMGTGKATLNNISINNSYAHADSADAYGGAIYLANTSNTKTISNATLINNSATKGGAIYSISETKLYDSLLKNNTADEGGAVFSVDRGFYVDGSSFVNNTADKGGAIYYNGTSSASNAIKNSNLTYNKAFQGSGIYAENSQFDLENDILLDNQAHSNKFINKFIVKEDDDTYSIGATFVGYDNLLNSIWSDENKIRSVKNVTYWDVNGRSIANSSPDLCDNETWQNITVERYDENGVLVSKTVVKTDANGTFKLNVNPGINVKDTFKFYHEEDTYYTYLEDTISNATIVKISVDDIYYGENATIKVNLTDGDGKPLSGNVTIRLNITGFKDLTVEVINGSGVINNVSGLNPGKYNATALFLPNNTYFGSSDWDTFRVIPIVVLDINKTAVPDSVYVGESVVFTINVTNVGPCNATGVNITDSVPKQFEVTGVTKVTIVTADGKKEIDAVVSGNGIFVNIENLNVGEYTILNITATALTNGTWSNTAHTICNENETEYNSTVNVTVKPLVNFTLIKKSNATVENNATVGNLVNFTITVTNLGPSNATNVTISDILNSGFKYADSEGDYNETSHKVTWKFNRLNYGESVTVWVTATALTNGFLPNTAHVNSTENTTGTSNKTTAIIYPAVNITLVKKSNLTENAKVGDLVNFTIFIVNYGPSNSTNVNISDILDSAFEYVESEGNYNKTTRNITWNIGDLDYGESTSVWVVVRVLNNGTFVNVASVNSTENKTGTSNKTNVTADPVVNLTLVKTSNLTENAKVGDLVNFTIVVTNLGPSNATDVDISDELDSAFRFVDSDGVESNGKVTWTIAKLNNGSSVSVWVVVEVLTNGTFENVATVNSAENKTGTSNKTNVTVEPVVNLTLVKTSNLTENANIYDLVNFTIVVTNLGPSNATDVDISDELDSAFRFVDSDGVESNGKITWNIARLNNGSSVSVWVVVKVLRNGTFENVATVNSNENNTNVSNKTNVTVNPAKSLVNGTDKVVVYGDSITVEVDSVNATSIIYQIIDEDGNVVAEGTVGPHGPIDLGVLPVGNYTVNLTTVVDEYHTVATNQSKLTVLPANSTVKGKDVVVEYGNPITVEVDSENATEIIYEIIDEDGNVVAKGTIKPGEDITGLDLAAGNYTVNLTTVTDKNHISSNNQSKITVNKAPSDVDVNDTVIEHGDVAEIPVKSENATGVTYEIIDKDGNVVARGNTTDDVIIVPGLEPGEYTIKVTTIVDENHTSTTSEAKITVIPKMPLVDLELIKMVDKTNIKEGEKVTYTIIVRNNGPDDATGVKVTDKAITQHRFVSASSDAYDASTGVWSIGDLANGSSVTLTITVIIEKAGIYENTAFVSSNENDTNMSNNNASSENVVVSKDNNTNKNETHNETTPQEVKVPIMHETGNPIIILLIVLMAIMVPQLRRFKK